MWSKLKTVAPKVLSQLLIGLLILLIVACNQITKRAESTNETQALFTQEQLKTASSATINQTLELSSLEDAEESSLELGSLESPELTSEVTSQAVLVAASGKLAYYRQQGPKYQLWIHDQATNLRTKILDGTKAIQSVAVSADANWVIASIMNGNQYDIYMFNVAANQVINLTNSSATDEFDVSMTANASKLAYSKETALKSEVILCDFNATLLSCDLTRLAAESSQKQASISSSGSYLALIREVDNGRSRVLRYDLSSNSYKGVISRADELQHPSISDDGLSVMFLRNREASGKPNLVRVKTLNDNTIKTIISGRSLEHPFLTADASHLAYSFKAAESQRVFTRNLITNERASAGGGSWNYGGAFWQTKIAEKHLCGQEPCWAFEETFDFDPSSPSQELLPRTFDYVVTHRSHPQDHFTKTFGPYPADHAEDCAGPNPAQGLAPQHQVISSHLTNGSNPDKSFFICKNHMMSSLGDVSGYSVSAFWPKQAFNFSNGGVLEFDVNINDMHRRSWFEIMITPREELKVGAARADLPIDESYPKDHIVLVWGFVEADSSRFIQLGKDQLAPEGLYVEAKDYRTWRNIAPDDPALTDRRIRRTMRISLEDNQIIWEVEKEDGSFDPFVVTVPEGLAFDEGLVVFKTHAYTPVKDGNTNSYTFHWDNIRFSGPVSGKYKTYETALEDVVYLQRNGDRDIGESQEITINLPELGPNPVLFGQVHSPQAGQVLLSINGASPQVVSPYDYEDNPNCHTDGWQSFRLELDPTQLRLGSNSFNWIIGERPACSNNRYYPWDASTPINTGSGFYPWNGFSIKNLEIQVDD